MQHPQIVVLGYSEAAMLLRKLDHKLLTGIISIHGSREIGVMTDGIQRLDLVFDDVDVPVAGDHVAEYHARQTRRAREEMGLKEVPPRKEDAEALIEFARPLAKKGGVLLAHCGAGVSRSPAAALFQIRSIALMCDMAHRLFAADVGLYSAHLWDHSWQDESRCRQPLAKWTLGFGKFAEDSHDDQSVASHHLYSLGTRL